MDAPKTVTAPLDPRTKALYDHVRRSCYSNPYLIVQREAVIVAMLEGGSEADLTAAWVEYTRDSQSDEAELPDDIRWRYHAAAELDAALIIHEAALRSGREAFYHHYRERLDALLEEIKDREAVHHVLTSLLHAELHRLSLS